jgi:CRP-like cAMP-binding protein
VELRGTIEPIISPIRVALRSLVGWDTTSPETAWPNPVPRDVLMLRILSFVGEGVILSYYYFQNEKLWRPIFWSAAYMMVNAVRIAAVSLERRPVILSDREEKLYRVASSSIDKEEFLRLVSLVRWIDCSPGEVILAEGQLVSHAIVVISGEFEAVLSSKTRIALRPGQLVGTVAADCGLACPVEFVARSPASLAKWDLRQLTEFTASRPLLRAKLLTIVNADLATKLTHVTAAVSGLTRERFVSELPLLGA